MLDKFVQERVAKGETIEDLLFNFEKNIVDLYTVAEEEVFNDPFEYDNDDDLMAARSTYVLYELLDGEAIHGYNKEYVAKAVTEINIYLTCLSLEQRGEIKIDREKQKFYVN